MKNITLAVDEKVLEQVRIAAARRRTTVNRLVRDYLEQVAILEGGSESARDRMLKLIDESTGRLGSGWKWNRDDGYEGRVLPGHQRPPVRGAG
jgi:hypothetical protein